MFKLKLFLLLLLFTYSSCETDKTEVQTTKLEKATDNTITQSDKRESRDISSTANFNASPKDEPFRPIFRIPYTPKADVQATAQSPVRYVTPSTPTQAQPHYNKVDGNAGIQYATDQHVYKTINSNSGYQSPPPATVAYPTAPTHVNYQQVYHEQQQQQQQQYYTPHARQPANAAAPSASPQPAQNYIYTSHINNQQDYATQQQQQQKNYYYRAQPTQAQLQHIPQPPAQPQIQAIPQQPIKYLLAVPHSYLQQLQQQYYAPQREQQHFAAAHPMIQVIGPLARDHQGVYRPIHQLSEPTATPSAAPMQKYTIQYLQIPLSRLLAAAQPAIAPNNYQHNVEQNSISYNQYPQSPAAYATPQPQQAYPSKPEPQPKPKTKVLQIVPAKSTPQPQQQHAAATTNAQQQHQQITTSPTPIVHYNPIYVQGPPPDQQPILGPLHFARHSHALHGQAPTVPQHQTPQQLPFIRILPANRYFNVMPMPQPVQYESPQSHISVSFPQHYDASRAQVSYSPAYMSAAPQAAAGAPYYQHGAGVHYGTHLYHPPTPSIAAAKALEQHAQQPAPTTGSDASNQQLVKH